MDHHFFVSFCLNDSPAWVVRTQGSEWGECAVWVTDTMWVFKLAPRFVKGHLVPLTVISWSENNYHQSISLDLLKVQKEVQMGNESWMVPCATDEEVAKQDQVFLSPWGAGLVLTSVKFGSKSRPLQFMPGCSNSVCAILVLYKYIFVILQRWS